MHRELDRGKTGQNMKKVFTRMATTILLGLIIALPAAVAAKDVPVKDSQPKPPVKIGIVDMQRIYRESKAARSILSDFQKNFEAQKTKITEKMKDIQKQEEEFNRLDPNTPFETRRQKADKLKFDKRDLNNLQQDAEAEAKRKEVEMNQTLLIDIMKIIREYAKAERYSIILERGNILAAEEGFDITDKIVKLYDSRKK